jgi:hypothetical protein
MKSDREFLKANEPSAVEKVRADVVAKKRARPA